jgi:amino acid adenylation domain-containing protein
MIVGVLAILKAGGAYVPLDPSYPPARLSFMVEDAVRHAPGGCPLILIQPALGPLVGEFGLPLIYLGENDEPGAAPSEELPEQVSAAAHDLAYVIYTSGSTGRPKGVMVTHTNLVNSTVARELVYPLKVERFLLLSSFAFDSSLVGIFGTLCRGGTLVLPPNRIEQDIAALARMIAEESVTHLLCLPSLYELLLAYAEAGQLASLRTVIVAGEVCPRRLAQRHLAVLPGVQLYNEYGPTEATVWAAVYAVPDELPPGQIAIGKPIANVQVYVLDAGKQPVPIGVAGELYIGGDNVAGGYLGQPVLTGERFPLLDDPLRPGQSPPVSLYRTGDLVRWRADGQLDYLGRTDQQVKIRGYRVELEEIERALADHPAVGEAVVVARPPASVPAFGRDATTVANLVAQLARLESSACESLLAEAEKLPAGADAMPTAAHEEGGSQ